MFWEEKQQKVRSGSGRIDGDQHDITSGGCSSKDVTQ